MITQEKSPNLISNYPASEERNVKSKLEHSSKSTEKDFGKRLGAAIDESSIVNELESVSSNATKMFEDAKEKATRATKRAVSAMDESARKHPWSYIGAAALTGGVLGYLLSHRMSSRHSHKG